MKKEMQFIVVVLTPLLINMAITLSHSQEANPPPHPKLRCNSNTNDLIPQVSLIARSDADIAIFGGDLNAGPIESPRHPYGMLTTVMKVTKQQTINVGTT